MPGGGALPGGGAVSAPSGCGGLGPHGGRHGWSVSRSRTGRLGRGCRGLQNSEVMPPGAGDILGPGSRVRPRSRRPGLLSIRMTARGQMEAS